MSSSTPDRLLEAAATVFAARGYRGTSLREIGRRAGVDPALTIRHFGSKLGLFEATLRREILKQLSIHNVPSPTLLADELAERRNDVVWRLIIASAGAPGPVFTRDDLLALLTAGKLDAGQEVPPEAITAWGDVIFALCLGASVMHICRLAPDGSALTAWRQTLTSTLDGLLRRTSRPSGSPSSEPS